MGVRGEHGGVCLEIYGSLSEVCPMREVPLGRERERERQRERFSQWLAGWIEGRRRWEQLWGGFG